MPGRRGAGPHSGKGGTGAGEGRPRTEPRAPTTGPGEHRGEEPPSPGTGRAPLPTVDLQASQKVSSVKRSMRLVLPTPRDPMMITCSLKSAGRGGCFLRRDCPPESAGDPAAEPAPRSSPPPPALRCGSPEPGSISDACGGAALPPRPPRHRRRPLRGTGRRGQRGRDAAAARPCPRGTGTATGTGTAPPPPPGAARPGPCPPAQRPLPRRSRGRAAPQCRGRERPPELLRPGPARPSRPAPRQQPHSASNCPQELCRDGGVSILVGGLEHCS